jgi:hypothetical protein
MSQMPIEAFPFEIGTCTEIFLSEFKVHVVERLPKYTANTLEKFVPSKVIMLLEGAFTGVKVVAFSVVYVNVSA